MQNSAVVDSLVHEQNAQNDTNIINLFTEKAISQFDGLAFSKTFRYASASKLYFMLSIIHFQMENNLKNTLEENNKTLMKNVLCFGRNHQTMCSPRFIFVRVQLLTTLNQITRAAI